MPKLPTFQAEGSVSQLAGTTSNVQVPLTQTLGTALKPVTDFVVKQKIKETDFQNKTEALKLENEFVTEMAKVYDEARICDCLANGTVDPTPTFDGRFWSRVIVETPAVTGVVLFIVK